MIPNKLIWPLALGKVGVLPIAVMGIGIVAGTAAVIAQEEDRAGSLSNSNLFCGPQAVQRVLEFYGQDVPLFDLVREIQWPDYRSGSSLSDLAAALESRGIHTFAVEVPEETEIHWDYPVILHVSHSRQQHYVVWLPPETSGGRARIWDGTIPSPVRRRDPLAIRSKTLLLTSERPISEPPVVGRRSAERSYANVMTVICIFIGGIAIGFVIPNKQRSRQE